MSHGLLSDPRLYRALLLFDHDLAAESARGGCPCGGRLHRADYPRKPRGGPGRLDPEYQRRHSFCCDRDGCRRRVTPPSVRFMGRRVYLAAVVVLVSAMRHGLTTPRVAELTACFGVSARTLARWRLWWRETFVSTEVWKRVCGRLLPAPAVEGLPASWLALLDDRHEAERVQWVLAWLLPLTTRTPGEGAGFVMGL